MLFILHVVEARHCADASRSVLRLSPPPDAVPFGVGRKCTQRAAPPIGCSARNNDKQQRWRPHEDVGPSARGGGRTAPEVGTSRPRVVAASGMKPAALSQARLQTLKSTAEVGQTQPSARATAGRMRRPALATPSPRAAGGEKLSAGHDSEHPTTSAIGRRPTPGRNGTCPQE